MVNKTLFSNSCIFLCAYVGVYYYENVKYSLHFLLKCAYLYAVNSKQKQAACVGFDWLTIL